MHKGTLNQVLTAIAKQLNLSPANLIQYAKEAPHAATRPDGNKWPSGTGSESEKRILYAVTKALQPKTVIDIGTRWGSCTLQILSAVDSRVISIDIETTIQGSPQPVGKFIPKKYQYEQLTVDATKWLAATKERADFIFEDTAHNQETTYQIYKNTKSVLNDNGVIISHDAVHPKFRGAVVDGIKQAGIEPEVYLVDGDSCGLAIWQKTIKDSRTKLEVATIEDVAAVEDNPETIIEPKAPKPKRKRRKSKKSEA